MSTFQRMVAIPQEEYMQLSAIPQGPLMQKMNTLEHEYQTIPQSSHNPYEHMMIQGSVLEEMKRLKEKIRDDISLGTPKPYRNRALSLYRSIEPHINLTQRGEVKIKDQVLENSRIEDLIQFAVNDRRRQFIPVGWKEFLTTLKEHNIPKTVLNRATLDELSEPEMRQKIQTSRKSKPKRQASPTIQTMWEDQVTPSKHKGRKRSKRKRRVSTRYPNTEFLKDF